MLTRGDIADVAGEQVSPDSDGWMQREGIAIEAVCFMLEAIERRYAAAVDEGDEAGAVLDIAGQAFRLGWESAKYAKVADS